MQKSLALPASPKCHSNQPGVYARTFLDAFGYRGATKVQSMLRKWPIERMPEIYDIVRPLYAPRVDPSALFHFAHADLSPTNVMVDPESGEIIGLIDWEMAGFRHAWLCETSGTWFDDDSCRFVMEDEDTGTDTVLRQVFLAELEAHNPTLLEHYRKGEGRGAAGDVLQYVQRVHDEHEGMDREI